MTTDLATSWQPLGTGRQSPVGAITDARVAARLAAYKHEVAGAYSSLALEDIARVVAKASPSRHLDLAEHYCFAGRLQAVIERQMLVA